MGIHELTQAGLPGITMRYAEGGKKQIFSWQGREIEFGPMASDAEIVAAFKAKEADRPLS